MNRSRRVGVVMAALVVLATCGLWVCTRAVATSSTLYVDPAGTSLGCGGPHAAACPTLADATNVAEGGGYAGQDVTIDVAAGTYDVNNLSFGSTSTHSLTITGAGSPTTTLDGQSLGNIMCITGGIVTLSGFTFTNGEAKTGSCNGAGGGAISDLGNLLVTSSTFINDSVDPAVGGLGGAIWNDEALTVAVDDTFVGDSAGRGGAFFAWGDSTLVSDTFLNDTATTDGGAVAVFFPPLGSSDIVMQYSTLSNDSSPAGALFTNGTPAQPAPLEVGRSILDGAACSGTITDLGSNVESDNTCGFDPVTNVVNSASIGLATALAANGSAGPQTLAIDSTSSAFEEVPAAACSPTLNPPQQPAITVTSDERGDPRPGYPGHGCDAGAFERQAPTAPGAPTGLSAGGGVDQVGLSWTAPASDGGSPITGYDVLRGTSAGGESPVPVATGVTTTTYSDTTVTAGVKYYYEVEAVNAVGASGVSNEASATPTAPPPPPLELATASLPPGQVGAAYLATLSATGGVPPYRWTVSGLPPGLASDPATGALSGVPSAAGAYPVQISVADPAGSAQVVSATLELTVMPAPLAVATTSLPPGQVGQAYSATLTATGGTAPYAWGVDSGALPAGLSLDPVTGAITGVPRSAGTASPDVSLADAGTPPQRAERALSITVEPAALLVATVDVPAGQVGQPYLAALAATGGTPPYSWSVAAGAPPAGVVLNPATGTLSGSPRQAGVAVLKVSVTDAGSPAQVALAQLRIPVAAAFVISTGTLPEAQVGQLYSARLTTSGGAPPYTWSVTAGALPPGLHLAADTGVLSGRPARAGKTTFSVTVTDPVSDVVRTATRVMSLTVRAAAPNPARTSAAPPPPAAPPPGVAAPTAGPLPGPAAPGPAPVAQPAAPPDISSSVPQPEVVAPTAPAATLSASDGPPGFGLTMRASGLPSTCRTVYVRLDGDTLADFPVSGADRLSTPPVYIPGNTAPGRHRLSVSCSQAGASVVATTAFRVTDASVHRPAALTSLPLFAQLSFSPRSLLESGILSLLAVPFVAVPTELLNGILDNHEEIIGGWVARIRRRKRPARRGFRQHISLAAFLLTSSVLYGFLDPSFGLNLTSLSVFLGILVSLVALTTCIDGVTILSLRRRERDSDVESHVLPGVLVFAVISVVMSRLMHFQPGYIYGLVAGLRLSNFSRMGKADVARAHAWSVVATILMSVAAYAARQPLGLAAAGAHPSFAAVVGETATGFVFITGIQGALFTLLPLRFLAGSEIYAWSRRIWGALMVVVGFLFVLVVLGTGSGYVGTIAGPMAAVVFAGTFALMTVGAWLVFRFYEQRDAAEVLEAAHADPAHLPPGGAAVPLRVEQLSSVGGVLPHDAHLTNTKQTGGTTSG